MIEEIEEFFPKLDELQNDISIWEAEHSDLFNELIRELGRKSLSFPQADPRMLDGLVTEYESSLKRARRNAEDEFKRICRPEDSNKAKQKALARVEKEAFKDINNVASRTKVRLFQKLDETRYQAIGVGEYIWRSQDDNRVRKTHGRNDDKKFSWKDMMSTGHPGHEYGCRCRAEPDFEEFEVAGVGSVIKIIIELLKGGGKVVKKVPKSIKKVNLKNTKTWPRPPAKGKLKEGKPSRNKPNKRGEKSLYDEKGGEWRFSPEDSRHNAHWDYKPPGKNSPWKNISIDGKPILK